MVAAVVGQYAPLNLPNAYRRYNRVEASVPFVSGGVGSMKVDQSGLLVGLLCTVSGTINVPAAGAAPTNHPEAPFNLIKGVTLSGGSIGKTALPVSPLVSFERMREADFVPSFAFAGAAGGGGGSSTPFEFDFALPICVRDGDLYGEWTDYTGSIYTGDSKLSLRLDFDFATPADVFTANAAGVTITASIDVTSFKLDTPSPDLDPALLAAVSWSHRFVEEQVNVGIPSGGVLAGVNDLPTALPRVYLRVLDIVRNNPNAYTDAVPTAGILASWDGEIQDTVDFERDVTEQVILARQARRYIEGLPSGFYALDFSPGNRRDNWLPVGNISIFRLTPTIGTTVALTNATYARYSEVLEPSARAATYMAAAAKAGKIDLTKIAA